MDLSTGIGEREGFLGKGQCSENLGILVSLFTGCLVCQLDIRVIREERASVEEMPP